MNDIIFVFGTENVDWILYVSIFNEYNFPSQRLRIISSSGRNNKSLLVFLGSINFVCEKYLPILNEILNKSCVLCGNFLVDSVQCSLNRKKKIVDSFGLKLKLPGEPDFIF